MTGQRRGFIPQRVGEVWVRRQGDQAAVYDPRSGTLHMLNPTALAIWELCDGMTTQDEMVGAIAEVSDAPVAQIDSDVAAALTQLNDTGLVEWLPE